MGHFAMVHGVDGTYIYLHKLSRFFTLVPAIMTQRAKKLINRLNSYLIIISITLTIYIACSIVTSRVFYMCLLCHEHDIMVGRKTADIGVNFIGF